MKHQGDPYLPRGFADFLARENIERQLRAQIDSLVWDRSHPALLSAGKQGKTSLDRPAPRAQLHPIDSRSEASLLLSPNSSSDIPHRAAASHGWALGSLNWGGHPPHGRGRAGGL